MKFNPEKHYLGPLCNRGHEYNGTGKSLRRKSRVSAKGNFSGGCIECQVFTSGGRKTNRRVGVITVVLLVCKSCGKEFKRKANQLNKNSKDYYCSPKCAHEGMVTKIPVVCPICARITKIHPCNLKEDNFCSPQCRGLFFSGEKSPAYVHGGDKKIINKKHRFASYKSFNFREVIQCAKALPDRDPNKQLILDAVERAVELKLLHLDNTRLIKKESGHV